MRTFIQNEADKADADRIKPLIESCCQEIHAALDRFEEATGYVVTAVQQFSDSTDEDGRGVALAVSRPVPPETSDLH